MNNMDTVIRNSGGVDHLTSLDYLYGESGCEMFNSEERSSYLHTVSYRNMSSTEVNLINKSNIRIKLPPENNISNNGYVLITTVYRVLEEMVPNILNNLRDTTDMFTEADQHSIKESLSYISVVTKRATDICVYDQEGYDNSNLETSGRYIHKRNSMWSYICVSEKITIEELRGYEEGVYLTGKDVVLCTEDVFDYPIHPHSEYQLYLNKHNKILVEESGLHISVDIVSNKKELGPRWVYISGKAVLIKPVIDKTREDGVYYLININGSSKYKHYKLSDAEDIKLFKSKEEALTNGDPKNIQNKEIELLKHEIAELKLKEQRIETETKTIEHSRTIEKSNMILDKSHIDNRFNINKMELERDKLRREDKTRRDEDFNNRILREMEIKQTIAENRFKEEQLRNNMLLEELKKKNAEMKARNEQLNNKGILLKTIGLIATGVTILGGLFMKIKGLW